MCKVSEYNKVREEIKRLEAIKAQMETEFINNAISNNWETMYSEDGIHYVRFTKAQEPKWVEEKITPAHFDNGKKAYIRYY